MKNYNFEFTAVKKVTNTTAVRPKLNVIAVCTLAMSFSLILHSHEQVNKIKPFKSIYIPHSVSDTESQRSQYHDIL